ncbi:MAG: hypothetical protein KJ601_07555, partial [Nanoarchaeota archaeon]|nr:hypothetical protein [Nanoarchaeota archaeon]
MKPFILLLLIILSCSMVAAEKDISVLVIHKQPTREMAMSAQSAQEPQIPLDIDIDRQYSAIDAYSATVDEATLEQLLSDPNIEVRMNGVKYIQLSDSVPIIRADQTRIAKVNNFNLTGQGQTV